MVSELDARLGTVNRWSSLPKYKYVLTIHVYNPKSVEVAVNKTCFQDEPPYNSTVHTNAMQGITIIAEKGACRAEPPDGRPSTTGAIEWIDTKVETLPTEFVKTTVTTVG